MTTGPLRSRRHLWEDLPDAPTAPFTMTGGIDGAVAAGLDWLRTEQGAAGQFPSYATSLLDEPQWQPDDLNFVTALTSMALASIQRPDVSEMRDRARSYLLSERQVNGLWRYWSRSSELHDYTPADADDTACCSLATGSNDLHRNGRLLLANRDASGRFFTWFLPRSDQRDVTLVWTLRGELRPSTRARRRELWANSEAEPNDVDVTVNANVIRYLGPSRSPDAAIAWVASVIAEGSEIESDKWYRSRTSLYRSVAAAATSGVHAFGALRSTIISRLTVDPGPDACRTDLEVADALMVLHLLDAPQSTRNHFEDRLRGLQRPDGSWNRSTCYFGGPQESFAWASEALTTATAVAAIHAGR